MLKALFTHRLFPVALTFFIVSVAGSLLYLQHIQRQAAAKLTRSPENVSHTDARPTQTENAPSVDETHTPEEGHSHADGTFHAAPHTHANANFTREQVATEPPIPDTPESPSAIAIGDSSHGTRTPERRDASLLINSEQYRRDRSAWNKTLATAHAEWIQASEAMDHTFPEGSAEEILEYLNRLSDSEKERLAAKLLAQWETYQAANNRLQTHLKEEPLRPTPPQNN